MWRQRRLRQTCQRKGLGVRLPPALRRSNSGRWFCTAARLGRPGVGPSCDDLAAILDVLGSGPIDLYGDSYGTFFEQAFAVRHPDKLRSIILDGAYPLVYDLEPARALAGNQASRGQLQIVTGALLTIGDAIARMGSNSTGRSVGLRGGSFDIAVAADGRQLTLRDVLWTSDLRVSGTIAYPGRSGDGTADLTVAGPEGAKGVLKARWTEGVARARAQVQGTFGNAVVAAETAAP